MKVVLVKLIFRAILFTSFFVCSLLSYGQDFSGIYLASFGNETTTYAISKDHRDLECNDCFNLVSVTKTYTLVRKGSKLAMDSKSFPLMSGSTSSASPPKVSFDIKKEKLVGGTRSTFKKVHFSGNMYKNKKTDSEFTLKKLHDGLYQVQRSVEQMTYPQFEKKRFQFKVINNSNAVQSTNIFALTPDDRVFEIYAAIGNSKSSKLISSEVGFINIKISGKSSTTITMDVYIKSTRADFDSQAIKFVIKNKGTLPNYVQTIEIPVSYDASRIPKEFEKIILADRPADYNGVDNYGSGTQSKNLKFLYDWGYQRSHIINAISDRLKNSGLKYSKEVYYKLKDNAKTHEAIQRRFFDLDTASVDKEVLEYLYITTEYFRIKDIINRKKKESLQTGALLSLFGDALFPTTLTKVEDLRSDQTYYTGQTQAQVNAALKNFSENYNTAYFKQVLKNEESMEEYYQNWTRDLSKILQIKYGEEYAATFFKIFKKQKELSQSNWINNPFADGKLIDRPILIDLDKDKSFMVPNEFHNIMGIVSAKNLYELVLKGSPGYFNEIDPTYFMFTLMDTKSIQLLSTLNDNGILSYKLYKVFGKNLGKNYLEFLEEGLFEQSSLLFPALASGNYVLEVFQRIKDPFAKRMEEYRLDIKVSKKTVLATKWGQLQLYNGISREPIALNQKGTLSSKNGALPYYKQDFNGNYEIEFISLAKPATHSQINRDIAIRFESNGVGRRNTNFQEVRSGTRFIYNAVNDKKRKSRFVSEENFKGKNLYTIRKYGDHFYFFVNKEYVGKKFYYPGNRNNSYLIPSGKVEELKFFKIND
ncbi:MAG: hypothetical protein AAGA64_17340 [Bacteroidota bacterium]